ncbi:DUF5719 family protein [Streptomyces globisporus]|uniref:DUF5719 family protein n=1 Tax=Streptomyces TaxID=1883 RepID=UPI0005C8B7DF|nr:MULTISPECIES: DUF5719 family protein [Streptomyces]PPA41966.1 hypothetical protein BF14_021095 [Streptomyces griseus]RAN19276.1 hypothetical protein A3838_20595 [Streptomyces badius]AWL88094.1 hypothetical protein DIJ69_21100 [Streptomyces globisporus]RAN27187.1 hypothetical protein A3800_20610 [Streptomyces badius]WSQ93726.1 DUF5719 family protein [Streptomyces globisporus]
MKSTHLSLIAGAAVLAAVTGFATVTAPGAPAGSTAKSAALLPVERAGLVCPAPSNSELAETQYTAFTPAGEGGEAKGAAELKPALPVVDDEDETDPKKVKKAEEAAKKAKEKAEKPVLAVKEPGKPVVAEANGSSAPALVGTATGKLAPGWTAQQTTEVTAGGSRGLLGVTCTAPDTDFWFPGASTAKSRQDYIHLTNPDDTGAVADIELYGPEGALKSDVGDGITVPARSSVAVLLSTLTSEAVDQLTAHVTTRSGRIGAVVMSADDSAGSDWITASEDPSGTLVMPGIPADATSVQLVAFAPGEDDADVKVQLMGKNATFSPAGNATLHIKSSMTASADLKDLTRGEPGSLRLSPVRKDRATPIVAALRVVRGKGDKQEIAYIPATGPVGARATVPDNRAKGSTLSLTAPGATAKVKVTASAGSGGGEPAVETYTVKAGTTLAVTPKAPEGLKGSYALTVETTSGGPVHASRSLALASDGVQMFTVQTLPDDRGMVEVPSARQDLSVLDD